MGSPPSLGPETTHGDGAVLVLLLADFLAIPLASERFLYAPLFAGFQIKGMALDLLDNVLCLDLALKPAQCILKGFAFLNSNLCQPTTPPNGPNEGTSQDTTSRWSMFHKSLKKLESRVVF